MLRNFSDFGSRHLITSALLHTASGGCYLHTPSVVDAIMGTANCGCWLSPFWILVVCMRPFVDALPYSPSDNKANSLDISPLILYAIVLYAENKTDKAIKPCEIS